MNCYAGLQRITDHGVFKIVFLCFRSLNQTPTKPQRSVERLRCLQNPAVAYAVTVFLTGVARFCSPCMLRTKIAYVSAIGKYIRHLASNIIIICLGPPDLLQVNITPTFDPGRSRSIDLQRLSLLGYVTLYTQTQLCTIMKSFHHMRRVLCKNILTNV